MAVDDETQNSESADAADDMALPPNDAAPPDVVADVAPTGPASHAPEATSGPNVAEAESGRSKSSSSATLVADDDEPIKMDWYILKVQSNREDSIRDSLLRRVQMEGLDKYFAEVIVPIETVTEF